MIVVNYVRLVKDVCWSVCTSCIQQLVQYVRYYVGCFGYTSECSKGTEYLIQTQESAVIPVRALVIPTPELVISTVAISVGEEEEEARTMVSAPMNVVEDTTRAMMHEPVHGSHDNLEEDSASVPAYGRIVEASLGDDNEEESNVVTVDFSSVPSPAIIALSSFEGAIGVGVGLTSSTGASGSGSSVGIGGLRHESVSKSEVEISTAVDNFFGLSTALSLLPKKEEDNNQGNGPLVDVQQHLQNVMSLLGEVPVTNLKEDGQQAASRKKMVTDR
ncbi:hypothetical protein R1flu_023704 [Riccia fluitans]|uniref:Uncharacterized protein n=1 Tax=Riccia fluitans TaxID=41844 RepID=A0ABD1XSY2_9MARC